MTNILIVYYSQTGHNFEMAKWAEDEAKKKDVNVRIRKVRELADKANMNPAWEKYLEDSKDIQEASGEDLEWADGVLISTPTRFGIIPAQMKLFIDSQGALWAEGKLMNKTVSAMTSAQNANGGQEMTLMSIYASMMHWGAIIVPPGYTDSSIFKAGGNPYGTSGTATDDGFANDLEDAVRHQISRMIDITKRLKI